MNKTKKRAWGISGAAAFTICALTLSACDFDVVNPGVISEDALNNADAIDMVLNGFIGDIESAFGDLVLHSALASDELSFSGTRSWLFNTGNGDMRPEDGSYIYEDLATAVWTATTGTERLQELGASADKVAQANLWKGFIHRMMGDNYCAYVYDGGEMQDRQQWFNLALAAFQAAASGSGDISTAAKAGQAQVLLALGRYSEAASMAAQVPDDFIVEAQYTDQFTSNLWNETQDQTQATVWNTPIADLGETGDPRTPWEDEERNGAGGDPFYRQDKYVERSDGHPVAKGWEMRLIEAEAAIRTGDVPGGMDKINYVRAAFGLGPQTAATESEALAALNHERLVVLWLEARRLYDLDRWNDSFLTGRDACFPFADSEINSNPNLAGCSGPACS
jgi:hypothetical protein